MKQFLYPKKLLRRQLHAALLSATKSIVFLVLALLWHYKDILGTFGAMYEIKCLLELFGYTRMTHGCLARFDDRFLYFHSQGISIGNLARIERQTIGGTRYGINLVMRDGRVKSVQFPELDDSQTENLLVSLRKAHPA